MMYSSPSPIIHCQESFNYTLSSPSALPSVKLGPPSWTLGLLLPCPIPPVHPLQCGSDQLTLLPEIQEQCHKQCCPQSWFRKPLPSLSRFCSHHLLCVLFLTPQIVLGSLSRAQSLYGMAFLILNFNYHSFICITSSRDPAGNQSFFILKYSIWSR